ncbi:NRDE family protein [Solimicrobium silvestre]|uniref:NRDE protein n=1 Tax=Solimicrobium silvestre TaxID=2099400 RepID=A0A2S9GV98_9BURK|nr:NRDE family protein [Solimicrobium silvestre]PRC91647.1 hypothetical protein S2091_3585 [Solimicrobium silvestre]
MCLIVFSWQVIGGYPLIAAANRDEYYSRETAPATWWADHPNIFAPRDLQAGGTWMGLTKLAGQDNSAGNKAGYKFAAITNVRDGSEVIQNAPSRGQLVSDYLIGADNVESYIQRISKHADHYNGFNLLVGEISETSQELCWFSNRNTSDARNGQLLTPGIYGLSNGTLDSPWPKVSKTKAELASLLCQHAPQEAFFEMLSNPIPAPDHRLPDTGVSLEMERLLSSTCIESENYGTRSSALLKICSNLEFQYLERVLR